VIKDEWAEAMVEKIEEIACMEHMIMTKDHPLEVANHLILEDHQFQKKFINVQSMVAVDQVVTVIETMIMPVPIQLVDVSMIMVVEEMIVLDRMMVDIFHLKITRSDLALLWINPKAIEIHLKIIIMMK
jgi:hypothetical protein